MAQVQIGEHTYEIGRLSAKKQFHVSRKLLPISRAFGEVWSDVVIFIGEDGEEREENTEAIFRVVGQLSEAFAALPDKDVDMVIDTCLAVARRQNAGGVGFSPVLSSSPTGELMFQDMDMPEMLLIVWHTLKENMGNFTRTFGPNSQIQEEISRRADGLFSRAGKTGYSAPSLKGESAMKA